MASSEHRQTDDHGEMSGIDTENTTIYVGNIPMEVKPSYMLQ